MKIRIITGILLIAFVLGGCSNAERLPVAPEVLPGIYMSSDPADLPLPASGYTVYVVGETHGNQETKLLFQTYLQTLYKKAGLRDVVLEEDQAYESDANAYVRGQTDGLTSGLCLRADILGQIREFNASLPADEKVMIHLVDVDSPFPAVYKHLTELHQQLGSAAQSIQIPPWSEFKLLYPNQMYELVEKLQAIPADNQDVSNGLQTVHQSIEWYFMGNDMDSDSGSRQSFFPLREDVITRNVQSIVSQLSGRPLLVYFGVSHGMKVAAERTPPVRGFKSWAQRLIEANIKVYSLALFGASGNGYWRGNSFSYGEDVFKEIQSKDGDSLVSLFESHPEGTAIYTDLRIQENSTIRLPAAAYRDIPASQIYDGMILFKEFTPMKNACAQ